MRQQARAGGQQVKKKVPARAVAEPPTARGRVLSVADDVKERGYCGGFCGWLNRDVRITCMSPRSRFYLGFGYVPRIYAIALGGMEHRQRCVAKNYLLGNLRGRCSALESTMFAKITFAVASISLLAATPALSAPCRGPNGKFIKCGTHVPAKPVRCKSANGKFAKCGTPGAKPV